jgi:PAS domain S-box-containing protein
LFEHLIESSTDFAMFSTAPDGAVTSWNIGGERLFGYTEEEILGRSDELFFTPEDRAAHVPAEEKRQALSEGRALDERWHLRKDGSRFWASGLLMPLRNPADGFVKITRDRTGQHRADEKLRQSEERFRVLATAIPQLVFRSRPDGMRTWASPQWCDFAGQSFEGSVGSGWIEALHPEDREGTLKAWREAPVAGEYYYEHRVRRGSDGEYRWHQTRAGPVNPGEPDTGDWVGTMTDIHDLRTLKDRQQLLLAELQHRTRNLLAIVQSIARQTRETSTSLDAFGTEFESRLRALSRVQSLLSRADHGDIDLRTLAEAELEAHGHGALGSGKIVVEGPPVPLPPTAAQALGLALHELATNALKYGALAQPSGRLTVSWNVEEDGPRRRVVLEWREMGVGMPERGRPQRRGYGTELIERALPYQLRAKTRLDFASDGVRCTIIAPIGANKRAEAHG